MPHVDSLDKIIPTYFAAVTKEPFTYKGVTYPPKPLHVSPTVFQGFTCPPGCGGCCRRWSLDYLSQSEAKSRAEVLERPVHFDGYTVPVYSDMQMDHRNAECRHLNPEDGRCLVHGSQPFSCDFEILRVRNYRKWNLLTNQLYSRGWNMKRTDGGRGAYCEIILVDATERPSEKIEGAHVPQWDESWVPEVYRKLHRLKDWTDHFGLMKTHLPEVLEWVASGPHYETLECKSG